MAVTSSDADDSRTRIWPGVVTHRCETSASAIRTGSRTAATTIQALESSDFAFDWDLGGKFLITEWFPITETFNPSRLSIAGPLRGWVIAGTFVIAAGWAQGHSVLPTGVVLYCYNIAITTLPATLVRVERVGGTPGRCAASHSTCQCFAGL